MNNNFAHSTIDSRGYEYLESERKKRFNPSLVDDNDVDISMTHDGDVDSPDSMNIESDVDDEPKIQADMKEFNDQKQLHDLKRKIETEQNSRRDYDYGDEKIGSESDDSHRSRSHSERSRRDKKVNIKDIKDLDDIPYDMLDDKTKKRRKMEKLQQLLIIKNSGIKLTQEYDYSSDYDEMCFEVEFWNKHQKKRNGIQLGKSFMLNGVQLVEFLNEKYDPFGARLKGWHDHMRVSSDSFDTVFGELYEKYNIADGKLQPEIKLLMMIIGSAISFHGAAKMAEKMPAIETILKKDPNFLANLQRKINGGISNTGQEKKPSEEEKQRQMFETMQKLKEQRRRQEELEKQERELEQQNQKLKQNLEKQSQNDKLAERLRRMEELRKQTNNVTSNKPNRVQSTNNALELIKAKNIVRRADNILNEKSQDSSSSESSVQSGVNEISQSESGSYTIGSDNKLRRRRRRNNKQTISIRT